MIGVKDGAAEKAYESVIVSVEPEQIVCQLLDPVQARTESPLETYLCQAVAKGDKMDLIIQKSVELGVTGIIPFSLAILLFSSTGRRRGKGRNGGRKSLKRRPSSAGAAQFPKCMNRSVSTIWLQRWPSVPQITCL